MFRYGKTYDFILKTFKEMCIKGSIFNKQLHQFTKAF